MVLLKLFVDTAGDGMALPQIFMLAVYGYILFSASKIISNGSEMLLSIYGPGIVGGLLIPILGAVPDAAIILVSGLQKDPQEKLAVGIGTLAGSTIMLLTLPWAAAVFLGRRDADPVTGDASTYVDESGVTKPKLTEFSLTRNVVTTNDSVPTFAKIMAFSALSYLIIQLPAFSFGHEHETPKQKEHVRSEEKPFALAGMIVTALGLIGYSLYQLLDARHDALVEELHRQAERKRWHESLAHKFSGQGVSAIDKTFHSFDVDNSGYLDRQELIEALRSLGLNASRQEVNKIMDMMDKDSDSKVSKAEFTSVFVQWINSVSSKHRRIGSMVDEEAQKLAIAAAQQPVSPPGQDVRRRNATRESNLNLASTPKDGLLENKADDFGGEDDSEEEEEEEYTDLTDGQLKFKAYGYLFIGTALVTVFSDPMVEVIGNFGSTIGISPFYVSFLITPVASNASEVISALIFAKKKTNRSMSLTLSSLYGAATMNNTLGLAIFMALVYFRHLEWNFSAEVIAILTVIVVVALNGMRRTIKLWQAIVVASMFPLSLVLVASLEKAGLK